MSSLIMAGLAMDDDVLLLAGACAEEVEIPRFIINRVFIPLNPLTPDGRWSLNTILDCDCLHRTRFFTNV